MTNNYSMIYADLNSSSTIWDWVNSTGGQIELKLAAISTIVLVVVLSICGVWKMVAHNPKSIETCNAAMKNAIIGWIIINVSGFIVNTISAFVQGGEYQATTSSAIIHLMHL